MDPLRFPCIEFQDNGLYDIQNNETVIFVRTIFNQIKENVNRLEFQYLLSSLNLLSGDPTFLEIIKNEGGNLIVEIFFSSEALRQVVQEAIIKRCSEYKFSGFDEWKLISKGPLYGLKLSDLQTSLILGRDPRDDYCIFYIQTILKKLKLLKSDSLMRLPHEFLFQLCTYLPVRDLNRFSQTCRKACELINSDKSDLIWLSVSDRHKIKVNLQSNKSVKEQFLDPWLELPFGKINQLTYEVIISESYMSPASLGKSCFLFDDILPIFKDHIPKDYYFQFEYKYSDVITVYMIFYRDEFDEPQHCLLSNINDKFTQLTEKLSETLKRCTGKFEVDEPQHSIFLSSNKWSNLNIFRR